MTETAAKPTTAQLLQQALFHHRQGQIPLAMERYTEALKINPNNGDALYGVAVVACQEGQFKEGAELARKAIANGLNTAKVYNLLGQALDRLGESTEAVKCFDRAIAAEPNFADAHGNRASILADADLPEEALKSFAKALSLNPNSPTDLVNRGALLQKLHRHAQALADYEKALALVPEAPSIVMSKANALIMLGRFAEAETLVDAVLAKVPKNPLVVMHKGLAAEYQGRFAEARTLLESAVALDPRDPTASYALAQLLLLMGEWRKAFPLYDSRLRLHPRAYPLIAEPQWNGELPRDFKLVLQAEQNAADTVQMARHAALLAARGQAVWLLAPETLAPLMRTLPGVERVVTSVDEVKADPRRILWLPLMSTPRMLHLMPENMPAPEPYLRAEPARVARFAEKLKGDGLKIGVHADGVPADALAALAGLPGVRLIALQKPGADSALTLERVLGDNAAGADAVLDLAALIANLDLVVSTDALPAHLAGALGVPVHLALPLVPDWRWLLNRNDTPWYANMRLYRQSEDRQWGPVFAAIAAAVNPKA